MRILIADDDPSLRLALRLVLEEEGYAVSEASTVGSATSMCDELHPEIVLVDAGIDGQGVTLWEALRHRPGMGAALLITGDVPSLGPLGSHPDVVGKPFDYDALLARLSEVEPR